MGGPRRARPGRASARPCRSRPGSRARRDAMRRAPRRSPCPTPSLVFVLPFSQFAAQLGLDVVELAAAMAAVGLPAVLVRGPELVVGARSSRTDALRSSRASTRPRRSGSRLPPRPCRPVRPPPLRRLRRRRRRPGPPTAAPIAAPAAPPPAAPAPTPTGCAPGAPEMGSRLASVRLLGVCHEGLLWDRVSSGTANDGVSVRPTFF